MPKNIDPIAHTEHLPFIEYQNDVLYIDGVYTKDIAKVHGTPCYVYSQSAITQAYNAYACAFKAINHQIFYAVKANSNLAVLNLLAKLGAGFDIVSKGELLRVLQVSDGKKVVYSGVGKTYDDIVCALHADIACFNVEAISELDLINIAAKDLGKRARISLRINPDVDAKTHPYISTGLKDNKFGIAHTDAIWAYQHAKSLSHLDIVGIDCHIGSQLLDAAPFVDALQKIICLIEALKTHNIHLKHIDIGGGLGVRYVNENPISVQAYADALLPTLKKLGLCVYLEPGRSIVANAGLLLTCVDVLKPTAHKNFAVVDASMAEMMRPALYQSVMAVIPSRLTNGEAKTYSLVGSVCESSDVLADERNLCLAVGDVLAMTGAGAYGFSMSSHYNTRPKPCEIMVHQGVMRVIRPRESYESLWACESL